MKVVDFLVIGSGIIGIAVASEIKHRHPDCSVVLIDKEMELAMHGSGRNSGVLHAGFYYSADTHKSRFTRDGNAMMRNYCQGKGLRINNCGKLVVAQDSMQIQGLRELHQRGKANGVELHWLSEKEAKEIEPRIRTYDAALWSPTTASVDPKEVVASLADNARNIGVDIQLDTAYIMSAKNTNCITTTRDRFDAGYVVNCAGLFADRIALNFGFSESYRILPFKGLYLYANANTDNIRTNVYPVPDLKYPFLGVHFTLTVDGRAKLGPTAIPAFWREHYSGLEGFDLIDFFEITLRELKLFYGNHFGFRDLAFEEIRKYQKSYMLREANKLLHNVDSMGFCDWGRPGIRAQLVNIKENMLEMDFRYEGNDRSFHVLNAVSPAFTCSLSFAEHLVDEIDKLIH